MKKFVVCLVAFAFMAAIAGASFGRTMEEEAQAVRNYLNLIDAKLAKAKKANQSAKINRLHAEKNATLLRWNKLKASMEAAKAPETPQPIYVSTPAPVETVREGRGIAVYFNGGLDSGLTGYAVNIGYDISGQPDQGVKIRTGVNYLSGTNPESNDVMKAASVKVGAIYYITPYLPSIGIPLTWYVGGAALYPFKVNAGRTGRWGGEAYLGTNYRMPAMMGDINFELGYGVLKYSDDQPGLRGLDLKIGYGILF